MTEDEFRDIVVAHARDNDHYVNWTTSDTPWHAACENCSWTATGPG